MSLVARSSRRQLCPFRRPAIRQRRKSALYPTSMWSRSAKLDAHAGNNPGHHSFLYCRILLIGSDFVGSTSLLLRVRPRECTTLRLSCPGAAFFLGEARLSAAAPEQFRVVDSPQRLSTRHLNPLHSRTLVLRRHSRSKQGSGPFWLCRSYYLRSGCVDIAYWTRWQMGNTFRKANKHSDHAMQAQMLRAADVIRMLGLAPHSEGGHFRETFRDSLNVEGARSASTAIYFLLGARERSRWHRLDVVEIWHYYAGAPLALEIVARHGDARERSRLGPHLHPASGRRESFRRLPGRQPRVWVNGASPAAPRRRDSTLRASKWRPRVGRRISSRIWGSPRGKSRCVQFWPDSLPDHLL